MLISYNWLKDYVDVKMTPEKLSGTLTMAGLSVGSIKQKGDDSFLDIEVTSNRPDWLSYIGIAREVAAITGKKSKLPVAGCRLPVKKVTANRKPQTDISIKIDDAMLCPRYTARVISGVKVRESPDWLKGRIEAMGLRPVNNIVDITNFCLFETGEPLHAFDLDKISGAGVIVRRAKKGEKIVTIDGIERALDDTMLVIADREKPIAIAGVMGGRNTEVTFSTNNVLLEAAYFDPVSTRRTSRKLGVSTESSYRFERRVDIENVVYSSGRASSLITDIAGGKVGKFFDIGKRPREKGSVGLRYSRLNKVLGLDVPPAQTKKILGSLGLKASQASKDKARFDIPHFRYDLKDETDLIEEVVRVYGYDKVPATIPAQVEQPTRRTPQMTIEAETRRILIALGADEIITYSLLSKRLLTLAGHAGKETVEIANPLSGEQEAMRPTLAAGMLNAVSWNINRKTKDLKLFEIGKAYSKSPDGRFSEESRLGICLTGQTEHNWSAPSRPLDLFDLKGMAETLLAGLGVTTFSFKDCQDGPFIQAASINIDGEILGTIGELSPRVLDDFDIKSRVYALEISIEKLAKHAVLTNRFKDLPRYPSVLRDISIVVAKEIANYDLTSAVKESAGVMLKDVKLIDRYAGKQIPADKVGLTYRLEYQDQSRTLEEKDVTDAHTRILRHLEDKFGAKLR